MFVYSLLIPAGEAFTDVGYREDVVLVSAKWTSFTVRISAQRLAPLALALIVTNIRPFLFINSTKLTLKYVKLALEHFGRE